MTSQKYEEEELKKHKEEEFKFLNRIYFELIRMQVDLPMLRRSYTQVYAAYNAALITAAVLLIINIEKVWGYDVEWVILVLSVFGLLINYVWYRLSDSFLHAIKYFFDKIVELEDILIEENLKEFRIYSLLGSKQYGRLGTTDAGQRRHVWRFFDFDYKGMSYFDRSVPFIMCCTYVLLIFVSIWSLIPELSIK